MATANPLPPPDRASSIADVRRRLDPAQRAAADAATATLQAQGSGDEVLFVARDESALRAWIGATFGPEANETHTVLRTADELDAYLGSESCAPSR
jgi:hypothetical protein